MKKTSDIQNQLASMKRKQQDVQSKLQLAELTNNNEEMLILEMQLSEIKGVIKALEWVLK
ncbi:MAG: hypothetical protein ACOZCL_06765 [Bacillota bacterium]